MASVLLVAAVGLCVFDGDHEGGGHHPMPLDLCLLLLVASISLPLLARLPDAGRASMGAPVALIAVTLSVPAPPPKSAPLA